MRGSGRGPRESAIVAVGRFVSTNQPWLFSEMEGYDINLYDEMETLTLTMVFRGFSCCPHAFVVKRYHSVVIASGLETSFEDSTLICSHKQSHLLALQLSNK